MCVRESELIRLLSLTPVVCTGLGIRYPTELMQCTANCAEWCDAIAFTVKPQNCLLYVTVCFFSAQQIINTFLFMIMAKQ